MKILHTSDWHLGHRLHEQSQFDEQNLFLSWLENIINDQQIDILLLAGDVFDTGVPATQSQKLYYDFLVRMKSTTCKHIVITGGNHDAPGTINAPKELLQALSIHVVGKATDNIEDEVFELFVNHEKVIIAAVPYLRDQDIRRAVSGESFDQLADRYKKALANHYSDIATFCKPLIDKDTPLIAMGHLFAIGGSTSDSEQSIYVGTLGDIGASEFPDIFNYVALGHLHRAQKVGNCNHIRYSGSPVTLSFSEIGHQKRVIVLNTEANKIKDIEEVPVPLFREIRQIKGTVESCIAQMKIIDIENYSLTPWIEVVLDNQSNSTIGFNEIHKAAEVLNLEVLKVTFKNERKTDGLEKLIENARHVKELSPLDVFLLKCKEQDFDIDGSPEILDAFHEILQQAKEH